ncbi:MAG TPA: hypothetical protein VIQ31_26325 [Phormidium sp.]
MSELKEQDKVIFVKPYAIDRRVGDVQLASIVVPVGATGKIIQTREPNSVGNDTDMQAVAVSLDKPLPDSVYVVWVVEPSFDCLTLLVSNSETKIAGNTDSTAHKSLRLDWSGGLADLQETSLELQHERLEQTEKDSKKGS